MKRAEAKPPWEFVFALDVNDRLTTGLLSDFAKVAKRGLSHALLAVSRNNQALFIQAFSLAACKDNEKISMPSYAVLSLGRI